MKSGQRYLLACLAAAALVVGTVSIDASSFGSRAHYITFSRSVALPGVELAAGTYVFELALPDSDLNLVRVSSRDRRQVYFTAFTNTIARPADLQRNQIVTFGEVTASAPAPIAVWYPSGLDSGRQFIYRR